MACSSSPAACCENGPMVMASTETLKTPPQAMVHRQFSTLEIKRATLYLAAFSLIRRSLCDFLSGARCFLLVHPQRSFFRRSSQPRLDGTRAALERQGQRHRRYGHQPSVGCVAWRWRVEDGQRLVSARRVIYTFNGGAAWARAAFTVAGRARAPAPTSIFADEAGVLYVGTQDGGAYVCTDTVHLCDGSGGSGKWTPWGLNAASGPDASPRMITAIAESNPPSAPRTFWMAT